MLEVNPYVNFLAWKCSAFRLGTPVSPMYCVHVIVHALLNSMVNLNGVPLNQMKTCLRLPVFWIRCQLSCDRDLQAHSPYHMVTYGVMKFGPVLFFEFKPNMLCACLVMYPYWPCDMRCRTSYLVYQPCKHQQNISMFIFRFYCALPTPVGERKTSLAIACLAHPNRTTTFSGCTSTGVGES